MQNVSSVSSVGFCVRVLLGFGVFCLFFRFSSDFCFLFVVV